MITSSVRANYPFSVCEFLLVKNSSCSNILLEVEFDDDYLIQKVVVYCRLNRNNKPTEFENIVIRVGDNPGVNGDFSSQTLFKYYQGMASNGEIVTLVPDAPVRGKFLSIKKTALDRPLLMDEIKIFN